MLAQNIDRVNKERAMRRRQLKGLVKRLKELQGMELARDQLLLKLGAAKQQFLAAWRLVALQVPEAGPAVHRQNFTFKLRTDKLRQVRRREGRYLLRSNLGAQDPAHLWQFYVQRRSEPAADLSQIGAPDRGPHFCGVSGLWSARAFASSPGGAGPRAYPAFPPGEVCCHPDARRALSDH